jgi:hypothetical protein
MLFKGAKMMDVIDEFVELLNSVVPDALQRLSAISKPPCEDVECLNAIAFEMEWLSNWASFRSDSVCSKSDLPKFRADLTAAKEAAIDRLKAGLWQKAGAGPNVSIHGLTSSASCMVASGLLSGSFEEAFNESARNLMDIAFERLHSPWNLNRHWVRLTGLDYVNSGPATGQLKSIRNPDLECVSSDALNDLNIGPNIKRLRLAAHMSRQMLAPLVRLSVKTVWTYEENPPKRHRVDNLGAVIEVLGEAHGRNLQRDHLRVPNVLSILPAIDPKATTVAPSAILHSSAGG